MTRKKLITIAVAVIFAVTMVIGGGTLAYLTGGSVGLTNQSTQNFNWVSISETGASDDGTGSGNLLNSSYEIVPGTSQDKDPTVSVSYSLDSYVFITIEDTTGGEIFEFDVDPDYWTLLTSTTDSDGVITYVYYHLCEEAESGSTSAEANGVTYYKNSYPVLEDNSISYLSSVDNETLVAEFSDTGDPTFYDDVEYKLVFQAYIVQADVVGDDGVNDDPTTCWQVVAGAQGLGYAAVGATLYQTVEEAILDLEEGGTVVLLANTTVSEGIAYSAEVPTVYTIDLNGYTMTIDNAQMQLSAVENVYVTESNFSEVFGEVYSSQYSYLLGYVVSTTTVPTEVTIENGTIECVGTSGNMRFESGTTLTLNDVEFVSGSGSFVKAIQYYVSDNTTTNTITVSNSTFDNTYIDICGSSNNRPYEVTATFTDCDFSATPGNGGGCVTFDSYIYGDFTFTDCNFEVTGGGNANGAIVINSSSSYCDDGSVNLVLNNNTITCNSTYISVYSNYVPVPVTMRNTSVVNVTDNKASAYSYTLDGEPVTYDGQAITVVTADGTTTTLSSALATAAADTTGNTVVELSADTTYVVSSDDITNLSNATIEGAEDGSSVLDVSVLTMQKSVTNLTASNITFVNNTNNYAFQVSGSGNFTNCVFSTTSGSGIRYAICNGDFYFEDCTISGAVYGINIGEGTGNVTLKNCDITGWNSFGNVGTVTIDGCTFHYSGSYGTLRFYQNATVTNCKFDSDFEWIDSNQSDVTITITDCTWTGHESINSLLYLASADVTGVTWIVDGETVTVTQVD
ncbi:MAG: right-handed parallel beta-helix repeat-containing protein [Oscillospiraceae bacterium]|nr:right-handed parallel beta-helix repeat-containing protein [Oscillospiraceae bacterium]